MVLRAPAGAGAPRSGMPAWASASSPPSRSPRHSETLRRLHPSLWRPRLAPMGTPPGPLQPVWGPGIGGCGLPPFLSWRMGRWMACCSSLALHVNGKQARSPDLAGQGALPSRGVQGARVGVSWSLRLTPVVSGPEVTPSREHKRGGVVEPLV